MELINIQSANAQVSNAQAANAQAANALGPNAKASNAQYEARALVIKALAHPARLKIVDELSEHEERCVCDLTELVGADMSTVSRHLAVLKNAGIVDIEKRGQMVFYRLRVKCLLGFFKCVESVIECNAQRHQSLLR